uniref:DM domain-containing protein n=1 Tax=Panagrolaimus sp. PS1159 TaxID=55785 RepID=A0AC35F7V6_9BILA
MEESMPMLSPMMMSGHDVNKGMWFYPWMDKLYLKAIDHDTGFPKRLPHCQRCAQHNLMNRLKGHKRYCPFRACSCPKC